MKHGHFHEGEIAIQNRLGIAETIAEMTSEFIRPAMPKQHRDFFEMLPFIVTGLADESGHPWIVPVFGDPGFVTSPSPQKLAIARQPSMTGELGIQLTTGQKIGLVGIELSTRRRNRMNGWVSQIDDAGFTVQVDQSFGNCPQYIQTRDIAPFETIEARQSHVTWTAQGLSDDSHRIIESSDTFFIASRSATLGDDVRDGIDASHRGGRPGFVRVDSDGTLVFPDFSGNRFFNTLGNIEADGRVGLWFPDFETGDAVFAAGRAEIVWETDEFENFEGAERLVRVHVEKSAYARQSLPLGGALIETSPSLVGTGTWAEASAKSEASVGTVRIVSKERESDEITSFLLERTDGHGLQDYTPGQFLPIRISDPQTGEPIHRTYTISQAPDGERYRLSVKREENGLASRILHDRLGVGDVFVAGAPAGDFVLQDSGNAIVMLSGGVGITPMLAMLEGLIRDVEAGGPARQVYFVHAARNGRVQAFNERLRAWEKKYDWLNVHVALSRAGATDILGATYDSDGYIDTALLGQLLPFQAYDFYICGPTIFMRNLYTGLRGMGIDRSHIHYEFFGEGSLEDDPADVQVLPEAAPVKFATSDHEANWTPDDGTLLEFAEKQGLSPMYGCRTGACGSCATPLKNGSVTYARTPSFKVNDGEALLCCARPASADGVELEL